MKAVMADERGKGGTACSVHGCPNTGGHKGDTRSYYRLPNIVKSQGATTRKLSERRRREWIAAISSAQGPECSESSRVCSDHFSSGGPAKLNEWNHPDWVPSLNLPARAPEPGEEPVVLQLDVQADVKIEITEPDTSEDVEYQGSDDLHQEDFAAAEQLIQLGTAECVTAAGAETSDTETAESIVPMATTDPDPVVEYPQARRSKRQYKGPQPYPKKKTKTAQNTSNPEEEGTKGYSQMCYAANCNHRIRGPPCKGSFPPPKDPSVRDEWLRAIRRSDFAPNCRVCSCHFKEEKGNHTPTLFSYNRFGKLRMLANTWSTNLRKRLNRMRTQGVLCDVTIQTKDHVTILLHSVVLAAASPVMERLLQSERDDEGVGMTIQSGFDSKVWKPLVDFLYTGSYSLNNHTFSDFQSLVEQLQVDHVTRQIVLDMRDKVPVLPASDTSVRLFDIGLGNKRPETNFGGLPVKKARAKYGSQKRAKELRKKFVEQQRILKEKQILQKQQQKQKQQILQQEETNSIWETSTRVRRKASQNVQMITQQLGPRKVKRSAEKKPKIRDDSETDDASEDHEWSLKPPPVVVKPHSVVVKPPPVIPPEHDYALNEITSIEKPSVVYQDDYDIIELPLEDLNVQNLTTQALNALHPGIYETPQDNDDVDLTEKSQEKNKDKTPIWKNVTNINATRVVVVDSSGKEQGAVSLRGHITVNDVKDVMRKKDGGITLNAALVQPGQSVKSNAVPNSDPSTSESTPEEVVISTGCVDMRISSDAFSTSTGKQKFLVEDILKDVENDIDELQENTDEEKRKLKFKAKAYLEHINLKKQLDKFVDRAKELNLTVFQVMAGELKGTLETQLADTSNPISRQKAQKFEAVPLTSLQRNVRQTRDLEAMRGESDTVSGNQHPRNFAQQTTPSLYFMLMEKQIRMEKNRQLKAMKAREKERLEREKAMREANETKLNIYTDKLTAIQEAMCKDISQFQEVMGLTKRSQSSTQETPAASQTAFVPQEKRQLDEEALGEESAKQRKKELDTVVRSVKPIDVAHLISSSSDLQDDSSELDRLTPQEMAAVKEKRENTNKMKLYNALYDYYYTPLMNLQTVAKAHQVDKDVLLLESKLRPKSIVITSREETFNLWAASEAVLEGSVTPAQAVEMFGVKKSTLKNRVISLSARDEFSEDELLCAAVSVFRDDTCLQRIKSVWNIEGKKIIDKVKELRRGNVQLNPAYDYNDLAMWYALWLVRFQFKSIHDACAVTKVPRTALTYRVRNFNPKDQVHLKKHKKYFTLDYEAVKKRAEKEHQEAKARVPRTYNTYKARKKRNTVTEHTETVNAESEVTETEITESENTGSVPRPTDGNTDWSKVKPSKRGKKLAKEKKKQSKAKQKISHNPVRVQHYVPEEETSLDRETRQSVSNLQQHYPINQTEVVQDPNDPNVYYEVITGSNYVTTDSNCVSTDANYVTADSNYVIDNSTNYVTDNSHYVLSDSNYIIAGSNNVNSNQRLPTTILQEDNYNTSNRIHDSVAIPGAQTQFATEYVVEAEDTGSMSGNSVGHAQQVIDIEYFAQHAIRESKT